MPNWTKEQELAIDKSGMNIIVSAGAGSGKTAVLTERVIRKLIYGEDITKLLILTFTNAAAKEMKERIRNAIQKNNLIDQLNKIDSSFITTFDSFALSIVKKYHYLIDVDSKVEIANDLVLKFKKIEILDNIFDELYENCDEEFLNFIRDFSTRDDSKIKEGILEIYNKIDLMYESDEYLDNYLDYFYNYNYIEKRIYEYTEILKNKIDSIKDNLIELELIVDGDFYSLIYDSLHNLLSSNTYDEIINNLDIDLPKLKRGMGEDAKKTKEKISNGIKNLKKICIYELELEIKNGILDTKKYVAVIIKIIKELRKRFELYKRENNLYDFLDISKLAIKIVMDYQEAREELQNSFSEILVDEYQDTSDLQEMFINQISNNNVYMVGDIKQSIYRFRNANPNLFKEKYLNYERNIGGFKIDLVKNFRSREEVLNNINFIFDYIMDIELGGADYKKSPRMVFGNTTYNQIKDKSNNYNFNIYNYEYNDKEYSKSEIEAFIVLKDIKDKVNNKYQIYDKNKNILRDITYDDFVILVDKSTDFELYKKIFEYYGVNLSIIKDEDISGSIDLLILKNILILIKCVKEKKYQEEFWYSYFSIGRSYLFNFDDNYLYDRIMSKDLTEDIILSKINKLIDNLDEIPIPKLIQNIIIEFNFYERLITVGNIDESLIKLDYIEELSSNLSNLGYTYLDLIDYFNKMLELDEKITYSLNKENNNSVKIMTIHKSKGLEYPICYYTGLNSKFNTSDLKKRFIFDNKLGIITPYINKGIKNTIYNLLYKNNYVKEDISERIRLFYVALTRAREKMIIVTSLTNDDMESDDVVELDTRLKYTSLSSILNSIKGNLKDYIENININDINLSKDYTMIKNKDIKSLINPSKETIKVEEFDNIDKDIIMDKHFSKNNLSLISKDNKEILKLGSLIHEYLEYIDFNNINLDLIDNKYKEILEKIFKNDLFKNIKKSLNIYKEYEFIYLKDNNKLHGIIDLMIEYQDYIDIIDYKLKNINDTDYIKQLKGYQDYIETISNKKINLYLYSIIDNEYIIIDN